MCIRDRYHGGYPVLFQIHLCNRFTGQRCRTCILPVSYTHLDVYKRQGGDTTGLDKALKNVNSSITKTQSALNDVNRLLKLDPSNTGLVAQKQELLAQAVSQTEEKLSALEAAQEQVAEMCIRDRQNAVSRSSRKKPGVQSIP